jgi:hypothetical protein
MKKLLVALLAAFVSQLAWSASDTKSSAAPVVKGQVLEVKEVDPYVYLRLKTAKGETWAAVNKAAVKTGTEVTIENPMVMRNFESKSLKRTFDTIVFGTLAGSAGAAAAPGPAPMPPAAGDLGKIHGGIAKTTEVDVAKVAKAEGKNGRTVAEVHSERAALKDMPVEIRGKVVKVTTNVMGRNWIHLRDGSGSAAESSDDILVTSKDAPNVGDVVVAKGVVRTDVKLGSGYSYKVLVEATSFQK